LSKRGFRIIGIDRSEASILQAEQHANMIGLNTQYKIGDAYHLECEDSSVDGVVMSDVLEHLHDLPRALQEVSRILKPDGVFVFDTVNRTIKSYVEAIILVQESPFGAVPNHTHDWSLFIKPEELKSVCSDVGMEVKEIVGLKVKERLESYYGQLFQKISSQSVVLFRKRYRHISSVHWLCYKKRRNEIRITKECVRVCLVETLYLRR